MSANFNSNHDSDPLCSSKRFLVIIQLCLAFSMLLWYIFQPFMGEYFAVRSRMLIHEYTMGITHPAKQDFENKAKLERQFLRFNQLPQKTQQSIKNDYEELNIYAKRPAFQKLVDGFNTLLHQIPLFEQGWMFFSVLISILILLQMDGARQGAWILFLIVCFYVVDNQMTGIIQQPSPDDHLFPTEKVIIDRYMGGNLPSTISEQKVALQNGWKKYLRDHWSPSLEAEPNRQLEEAEFSFTLARLQMLIDEPKEMWLKRFHKKAGLGSIFLFLLWSGFFAWRVNATSNVRSKPSV